MNNASIVTAVIFLKSKTTAYRCEIFILIDSKKSITS